MGDEAFSLMQGKIKETFNKGDTPEVIRLMEKDNRIWRNLVDKFYHGEAPGTERGSSSHRKNGERFSIVKFSLGGDRSLESAECVLIHRKNAIQLDERKSKKGIGGSRIKSRSTGPEPRTNTVFSACIEI